MEPAHGSTPRPLGRAPGRVCEAEHRRQRGARPVAVGEGRWPHTCWGEGQKGRRRHGGGNKDAEGGCMVLYAV